MNAAEKRRDFSASKKLESDERQKQIVGRQTAQTSMKDLCDKLADELERRFFRERRKGRLLLIDEGLELRFREIDWAFGRLSFAEREGRAAVLAAYLDFCQERSSLTRFLLDQFCVEFGRRF